MELLQELELQWCYLISDDTGREQSARECESCFEFVGHANTSRSLVELGHYMQIRMYTYTYGTFQGLEERVSGRCHRRLQML